MKPLAIDLFAGSFGWSAGWLELGGRVIGFDLEHLPHHGDVPNGAELVIQDVLTLHGSQFKNASLIFASPPCTEYSYMAMPWRRAKQIEKALYGQGEFPKGYAGSRTILQLNALFSACFRIQREASEAAGHHIPLVLENVCGAQKWVGRAKTHWGSFYLWGDVPALMPITGLAQKFNPDGTNHPAGSWFAIADSKNRGAQRVPGFRFDSSEKSFQPAAVEGVKCGGSAGDDWFAHHNRDEFNLRAGIKQHNSGPAWFDTGIAKHSSKSNSRKAASAMIAKIPFALAVHIARCFKGES